MSNFSANWDLAAKHASSLNPGIQLQSSQVCPCCHACIQKQEIPLCEHTKELAILGPGFPLYFIFLKYSIMMMFLLVVSYSALAIFWAYEHNYNFCLNGIPLSLKGHSISCTSWMVLFSRLENKIDAYEMIIRFTSFITQLIILAYIREQLRKYKAYFQELQDPQISDYSILIKNIPQQEKIQDKIKRLFEHMPDGNKYTIECIYPIALEQKSYSSSIQLLKSKYLKKVNAKHKYNEQQARDLLQKIHFLAARSKEIEEQQKEKRRKDETICQKVIVTFSTEKEKQEILDLKVPKEVKMEIFGKQDCLEMVSAPEPSQIIWENINISRKEKIKCLIQGWLLFVTVLAVITCIFYWVLYYKAMYIEKSLQIYKKNPQGANNLKKQALIIVVASLTSIIIFNKLLLSKLLYLITKVERHKTAGAFELSLSIKYALGLVFTTAFLTLLIQNIRFHNIYEHDFGVIEEETMMYLFSAFFVPLIWFFNPWYVYKVIKMYFSHKSNQFTQHEANQIMELPQYNIGKRYGQVIETVWFTYFYASLIPLGAPISLLGECIFYWVDKYNLLRKSSLKQNLSGDLSMKALVMLDLTLVLKPLGEIAFDLQIRQSYTFQSIALLILAVLYVVAPKETMLDWINGEKYALKKSSYKQTENNIPRYSHHIQKANSYEAARFDLGDNNPLHSVQQNTYASLAKEAIINNKRQSQCPEEVVQ